MLNARKTEEFYPSSLPKLTEKGGAMKGWVRSEQRSYKDYGQRRFVEKDES